MLDFHAKILTCMMLDNNHGVYSSANQNAEKRENNTHEVQT